MARGATLESLISDLRDELRRVNNSSAAPDDLPSLRRTINHVYATLHKAHDWPHLTKRFTKIPLAAGQQYYDLPTGLDPERVIEARIWWSSEPHPIERGITFEDYAIYDPSEDERTDPALKWDFQYNGANPQIEIWPLPASNDQELQFRGVQAISKLVNNTDICVLDDDLVVLYAAAELLPAKSADKDAKLNLARELLRQTKLRGVTGGEKTYRIGLGSGADSDKPYRAVVRIGR